MRLPSLVAALLVAGCTPADTEGPPAPNVPAVAILTATDEPGTLDGCRSYDPDATEDSVLLFHWSFDYAPPGSAVDDSTFDPNHDESCLTTFWVDVEGTYVIELVVDDGEDLSGPVFSILTYTDAGAGPQANAGPPQTVELGEVVTVDGRQSYCPLGGALEYAWTLENLPYDSALEPGSASITDADREQATFTPDVGGAYGVLLTVTDSVGAWSSDSTSVTAVEPNEPPVAHAGEDQEGEDCTLVELSAADSYDPEGEPLSYFWELQIRPADSQADDDSFSDRIADRTTFWPDVAGEYALSVSVYDGTTWSEPDWVTLTLEERADNTAPMVDAGADRVEDAGEAECVETSSGWACDPCVDLRIDLGADGSISDAEDDPWEVSWIFAGPTATYGHTDRFPTEVTISGVTPVEPGACEEPVFDFVVSVVDCPGAATIDDVEVTVECCGVSP